MKWASLFALATLAAPLVAAQSSSGPPSLEIVGNKFFYSNNGSEFYIRGVAYQSDAANATAGQSFSDPLADGSACQRDLPFLLELQTNVIRVYAVNTSLDHTDCLNLFADNGIYVIADLSEPGLSVNRDDPQWTVQLYNRYTSVVDILQKFPNVMGFFAGNEVTNNNTNTDASPFVRAAIRDTKAYIKAKGYRPIPVGYSSNDDSDTRVPMADYFTCGDDDSSADFYGINMYEWCGDSNFVTSGYQARTEEFKSLNVPLFFSEYGCNAVQPRQFTEVATLFSSNMTDVWCGGIVYMYFQEANNYGLVTIQADGSVSTLANFNSLSAEIASVSPTIANTASVSSGSRTACPASTGSDWMGSTDLPPTPQQGVCNCLTPAAACVVGDKVDSDDYGTLFGYLCDHVSCAGISGNGTSGEYGAFSFCDPKDQLNYVLNLYYAANGANSAACDFSGSASVVSNPSTADVCQAVFSEAGSVGAGQVTASVSGSFTGAVEGGQTGAAGGSSGGSAGAAAASGSSSSSASASATGKKSAATKSQSSALAVVAGAMFAVVALMGIAI